MNRIVVTIALAAIPIVIELYQRYRQNNSRQTENPSNSSNRNNISSTFEATECVICKMSLGIKKIRIIRACNHIFHEECLKKVNPKKCPMCRTPFTL